MVEKSDPTARIAGGIRKATALPQAAALWGGGRNSEPKQFWAPLPEPATLCGGRGMRDVTESRPFRQE